MVTKQRPAAPGGLERQQRRQRAALRNRKLGAIAVSAILVTAIAVFAMRGPDVSDEGDRSNRAAGQVNALSDPGVYRFDLQTEGATPIPGVPVPDYYSPGIAPSPDGTMITYPVHNGIAVANVDGTDVRVLDETDDTGSILAGPQFSPDGSTIAYQAKDGASISVGNLFLVDVATGRPTQLTHMSRLVASQTWFMGPTFSPDGQRVYFTRPTDGSWGLWSVPTSGGKPTLVLRHAIGGRLAPDGRTIVYFKYRPEIGDFGGEMWVAAADGSDAHSLDATSTAVFSARWSPDSTRIAYLVGDTANVVDVATGEVELVLRNTVTFPEWIDDHTWIVGA